MIQFLLNQTLVTERDIDPNMTVLNYLRERRRRPGTKEGCASGDCGACTVTLGRVEQGRMRYETANACLTLISALQGKQLITVEDLRQQGALHPVQQAVVDLHASQCGFCTPGIVMTLFTLQKNSRGWDRQQAELALAGNLCRCTGYRPIMDAARLLCEQPVEDSFSRQAAITVQRLSALQHRRRQTLKEQGNCCFIPKTLGQLADCYRQYPRARLLAGGTDLALEITQACRPLPLLIALDQVEELQCWQVTEDSIELGAGLSISQCASLLSGLIPSFADLLRRFASQQIRNRGTLGGNIGNASPIGDTPPLLLALDAQLRLQCGDSERRLPLHDFFLAYRQTALREGEFIRSIVIPRGERVSNFRAWKVAKRPDDDISAVAGAFAVCLRDGVVSEARIAFGGMDAIPRRAPRCEQALCGRPWNEATLEAACRVLEQEFTPLSDFRASADYRRQIAGNLLRRYYLSLQGEIPFMGVADYVA
ncbi:xanthine dehydrogenase small subunit [Affinibrenneria salicis]|uniref:Xanthine dehydrogenase small subunit n=1 Tax=Affinibrenneria salicis TaxID=2590031 RepID=A0A5J5G6Y7_9GAMM|nr:xanthine dehydrogenase small subunit [Affinibrenneria salicis]KAA9002802.1 xanthine dehydrogenase small subunit [Affinibrenneria salicis]KAA9002911.1 xanthine dehydrogenase small subunit [Affinibrenneria salicis]